jgi:hypothetical protein
MLGTAQQLAGVQWAGCWWMRSVLRWPRAMIDAIRARTAELQQRMNDAGIVPGSTRALRLFS